MTAPGDMLDARAAAAVLGVSARSMYALPIARYRLGPKLIRWARADLEAYIVACRREPARRERGPVITATVSSRGVESASDLRALFRRLGVDLDRAAPGKKKAA